MYLLLLLAADVDLLVGLLFELLLALQSAEVIGLSLVLALHVSTLGVNVHLANRVWLGSHRFFFLCVCPGKMGTACGGPFSILLKIYILSVLL